MEKFDLIVFGKGLAGLSTAYSAAVSGKKKSIAVFSKSSDSNSIHSQGGIACALSKNDSWKRHFNDTLKAGNGLCDKKIVEITVKEGIERINELIESGLEFDSIGGKISFGMEAAHSVPRILHINGDQTGKGITAFLGKLAKGQKNISFIENAELIELINENGKINSAIVFENDEIKKVESNAIVLATGGYSSLWKKTTNPPTTTGEAAAIAHNSGALLKNLEFEQFHPTTLAISGARNFLISESVRGEGAILLNDLNERFMQNIPGMELAARDVLSREIYLQLKGGRKVFLDAGNKNRDFLEKRFPKIYSELEKFNVSMEKDLIPVEPAAHYSIGGIKCNEFGETNVSGLFAVGECSCNGLHGANRLASNSLLEAVVFGFRAGKKAIKAKKAQNFGKNATNFPEKIEFESKNNEKLEKLFNELKTNLWKNCGIARNKKLLENGLKKAALIEKQVPKNNSIEAIRLKNQIKLSKLVLKSALGRKKSVGSHFISKSLAFG